MFDTIDLTSLDPWLATPACNWEAAVETLMLSLAKHNVAILKLPSNYSDEMNQGMLAVAGLTLEGTPDPDVAMPEESLPQPEPYLLRDPSPRQNPPSPGLVQTHPGKLVCEHWEGLPLTTNLHVVLHMVCSISPNHIISPLRCFCWSYLKQMPPDRPVTQNDNTRVFG